MQVEKPRTDVVEGAVGALVGIGILILALFPLAIPLIALTAVALLPLLVPVLALALVAAVLAAQVALVRRLGRRRRNVGARREWTGHDVDRSCLPA
jgi:hypothetical protein